MRADFFSQLFPESEAAALDTISISMNGPSDVSLLSAEQNPDPLGGRDEANLIIDENAIISNGPIDEDEMGSQTAHSDEISVYTVREGDSLSQVAQMFGVTSNTILWANDLKKKTDITPGQSLLILPIAGVRHVVKKGDTVQAIAKKYEGDVDEILSYNQLASATDISTGDTLIIPGGEVRVEAPKKVAAKAKKGTSTGSGSTGLINPAPGSVKSQGIHGNNGVDLAAAMGSTIRAAAAGQVIVAKGDGGWNGGYGNYIVIKHKNGTQTLYAHLSSLSVAVGDVVDQSETIGGMGNSGKSTGTHLHFEVRGGRNPF